MASLTFSTATTVAALKSEFNAAFGATLRVYNGGKVADDSVTLGELGLSADGPFECRSSLTVDSFIERMKSEHNLKVKVYTCDGWVAVLGGLTLESAGKVKKNAVKADMESMIAYQRADNSASDEYSVIKNEDGSYTVSINGVVQDNAKAAMRQIAEAIGFDYDPNWTTRQFGSKLAAALGSDDISAPVSSTETAPSPANDISAEIEAARKAAEKAKAQAEAEAKAAKDELARIQAEAEKAKKEAEDLKAAAEKAKAEADSVKPSSPKSTSSNGALCGLFSVGENKKIRFSMGNLQFHPKNYEFRFALHQWDIIGEANARITPNYDGWMDLFGYGTSGYMGCEPTERHRPGSSDQNDSQYPQIDICNTNYDWGQYNPIVNGGNKEGLWRTLTHDEFDYLWAGRANAEQLKAKANIEGKNGVILLPDDFYEHRVRIPFDCTPDNFTGNTYSFEQWSILEAVGAVFLPVAGDVGLKDYHCNSFDYHLSTIHEAFKSIWVDGISSGVFEKIGLGGKRNFISCAVRLVQDA